MTMLQTTERKITYRPATALKPLARNARTHSVAQIKQIARSIERFGFNNPVLVDDDDRILAGHGRLAAAQLIGLWSKCKREDQAQIDAAIAAGQEPPDILPHPADISLNYHTLNVEFRGAFNRADREDEERRANLRDLLLELAIYTGENNHGVPGDDDASTIGIFLSSYLVAERNLPPSLRRPFEDVMQDIIAKASMGRYHWSLDLEKRCKAANFPFIYTKKGQQTSRAVPLSKLGFGWVDGRIEPVDPEVIKERDEMLKELNGG